MKMRHISVFRVKDSARDPEIIDRLAQLLRELPSRIPTIRECEVGVKPFPMPTESPDGHVQFYDLIQIITFDSPEDCMAYPASDGHRSFLNSSGQYMEQVVGIDYPVE